MSKLFEIFANKRILVTGGTGSIGCEIVKKLIEYNPKQIRIFSRDEHKQFLLQEELKSHVNVRLTYLIGDIRDKERLMLAMENIDYIFHAAALKHVPYCEFNPFEAVKTNVYGTQNVLEAARMHNVKKFIGISTDKAASPINTMGATKLLAEKLIMNAEEYKGFKDTIFSVVRFGNVLGSRGSVVPLFEKQIRVNKEITITDPEMTRFFMSIPQAVDLVFKAANISKGGDLYILKMPVLKLMDLAESMIEIYSEKNNISGSDIKIKIIGKRAGEKNYELLISEEESDNIYESDDMYLIRKNEDNEIPDGFVKKSIMKYNSSIIQPVTKSMIKKSLESFYNERNKL